MSKEGLGKGLDALISGRGRNVAKGSKGYLDVREKEKELETLEESIGPMKKEVEEKRKNLTITLMLEGKVDKTELGRMEEKLGELTSKKMTLQKELDDLRAEMSIDLPPENGTIESRGSDIDVEKTIAETIGSEIDMRMVRDLMPDGGAKEEAPGTDAAVDEGHVERLKEELDRSKVASEVRREAYGGQEAPESDQRPRKSVPLEKKRIIRSPEKGKVIRKRVVKRKVATKVKRDDSEVLPVIKRSLFLMQSGEMEEAKRLLETALEKDRTNDELLYHLGNVYFVQEELETAEFLFMRSIEVNDRSYRAFNNLGVVQRKLGKKESAIRSLNRSIELEPNYERAWLNLGTLFMEIDPPMLTEASIFLRRALECQPNYLKAREKLDICQKMMESG